MKVQCKGLLGSELRCTSHVMILDYLTTLPSLVVLPAAAHTSRHQHTSISRGPRKLNVFLSIPCF